MITPRLSAGIASMLLCASFASAKPTKKPAPKKTLGMLVDHVLTKGGEWPIKAPSSRTLGYETDSVPAKSLGLEQEKSADKLEHGIYVVYENDDKGKPRAKEVILHQQKVVEKDGGEYVDSYKIRSTLDGTLIKGLHAVGMVGKVVQTPLEGDSAQLKTIFKAECDLYLQKLDWKKLTFE